MTKKSKKKKSSKKKAKRRPPKRSTRNQKPEAVEMRHKIFVKHFLIYHNATQAAIFAGYSKKTAAVQGHTLLRDPNVREAIDKKQQELEEKLDAECDLNAAKLRRRLVNVLTTDIADIMDYDPTAKVKVGKRKVPAGLQLRDLREIPPEARGCIKKITQTQHGFSVMLESKLPAIAQLAEMIGAKEGKRNDESEQESKEAIRKRVLEIMEKNGC